MELREYLETAFANQAEAAAAFRVSQGTISHWKTGRRRPTPNKALEIIRHSRGKVSYQSIYQERRA
jgi:DNA-binding transcriptional regulator YdaS (Cro superfamily)